MREPEYSMLLHYLHEARYTGTFPLRSGQTTDVYVDVRQVCCDIPGRHLVGALLWEALRSYHPVSVGGSGIGGLLVAQSVGYEGRLSSFVVRSQPKHHGLRRWIEGRLESGDQVVLVEDVVSTGHSVLAACKVVTDAGATVLAVGTVLNRGGATAIEAAGYPLVALVQLEQLAPTGGLHA